MTDLSMLTQRGLKKIDMAKHHRSQFFFKSLMAGFFLGATMILSYTLGFLYADHIAVSKTMIAFSFGIGLVCISFLNAELFTGNCLTIMFPIFTKKAKIRDIIPVWVICYLGNIVGICFITVIFMLSLENGSEFNQYITNLVDNKFVFTMMPLFLRALLCNFVVCIASFTSHKMEDGSVKLMVLMVLVATFVIAGLEHCIANWGIFAMNFVTHGFQFDWSAFPIHMLISTIGNIIGGALLLGYPLYLSMDKEK